jgi:hypothetical protein
MLKTTTLGTRAILGAIGAGGLIAAAALAPSAHTDTLDPHISNPTIGWCPGGGAGGLAGIGFCDGARYTDGSYWHVLRGAVPFAGSQMRDVTKEMTM